MKQAGEEEKAIAISKGHYHQAITVIMDSGWSKQSHKHSYNAKSGVGIIIGKERLGRYYNYMGVRNKYCSVCYNTTGDTVSPHNCFLNWDQSSSAMETDIIVTRFFNLKSSMASATRVHFIGDGDSSVYPALVSRVPYGYFIKKLECANHAVKCFWTTMQKI